MRQTDTRQPVRSLAHLIRTDSEALLLLGERVVLDTLSKGPFSPTLGFTLVAALVPEEVRAGACGKPTTASCPFVTVFVVTEPVGHAQT